MALTLGLLLAGALVLYGGARLAVRGAVRAAAGLGVGAFALGALVFGVDVEGLGAALTAAGRGDTEIAAGGAFGSALFVVTVGLGLTLVLARRAIPTPSTLMLLAPGGAVLLAALAISDRHVDRFEGVLLVIGYAGYVFFVLRDRAIERPEEPEGDEMLGRGMGEAPRTDELAAGRTTAERRAGIGALAPMIAGVAVLYAGSWLLIEGGARLSLSTGLEAGLVGAAVVGVLTSLDEVLLGVLSVRRGVPELATGNLFGTLTAFTTGVLGLAALVRPLTLDSGANLAFLATAFLYALVAVAFLWRGRIGGVMGAALLGFYVAWLVYAAGV